MRVAGIFAAVLISTSLQAADPVLLNLVMPDAKVVAGINVQRAKSSPFGQYLLNQLPAGTGLTEFAAITGFDPRQDLVEVLMASNGQEKNGLVVARGTFNIAKISAAVLMDGKHSSQTYKGIPILAAAGAGQADALGFLSGGIAMAGDLANVKAAIDRSTSMNTIDSVLASKISGYSGADAWSVSIAPLSSFSTGADAASGGASNPIAGALKTIQQASGSVVFGAPVQISVEAQALTDQDATSLSDVLRFVVGMALGNADSAPFADILKTLDVSTDHTNIKVRLSIPEDQLENLLKNVPSGSPKHAAKKTIAHV